MVTLDQCGWLGAGAVVVPSPPELTDYVEHSFVLDMSLAARSSWMIVPDPSAHIIVHGENTARSGGDTTSLVGARTTGVDIELGSRSWTVGVRLRPGALPPIAGLPAHELTDRGAGAGSIWGAEGDRLASRIRSARGPGEVHGLLLDWIAWVIRRAPERHWMARASDRLTINSPDRTVENVADAMGASVRTLRARSQRDIGLAPKRLLRIRRLYGAIDALRPSVATQARVAGVAGFTDQSHLTREFHALLGETPGQFLRRGARRADSYKPEAQRNGTFPSD